jgi:hypothetical protein
MGLDRRLHFQHQEGWCCSITFIFPNNRTVHSVVSLTRTNRNEYSKYTQLYLELDKLIARNNQTPKPAC